MSQKPKVVLSEMDLDEVSSVILGDNPGADILIFKGMPDASAVHHDRPLSDDFKYKRKMKRKKKKDAMKKRANEELEQMAAAVEAHYARRRIRG